MSFKSQPPFSYRTEALVSLISPYLCSLSRLHIPRASHEYFPAPAPFFKGPRWRRSRCSGSDRSRASRSESRWTQPRSGGGGAGKGEHPKTLGKTFFLLTWRKNTARASAGMIWAREKPWTLAGTRRLVLNTFTGEGRLKEQNQRAKETSHCQLPVQCTWV